MALKNEKDKMKKDELKTEDTAENKTETSLAGDNLTENEKDDIGDSDEVLADTKTQEVKETVSEIEKKEKEKVVYIGPNIKGLLQNTVFDYLPSMENYKDYENIEKLFIKLPVLKKSLNQLREKSNYLHIIYEATEETELNRRKEVG